MKLEWRAMRFDTGERKKERKKEWMKERKKERKTSKHTKKRGREKEIMFCKFNECDNKNWKTS